MNVRRALSVTRNAGRDQVLLTSEKDLIYVAGRNVVWHNHARDRVRVLPQTPRTTRVLAIAVCPKKRYVAVCEEQDRGALGGLGSGIAGSTSANSDADGGKGNGSGGGLVIAPAATCPQVSIIDLISGSGPKRLRTLVAAEDTHLSFTLDADSAAAVMTTAAVASDGGSINGSSLLSSPNFTCADFSRDSKLLLCLVGAPYNGLVVFDWFRSRKIGTCTINARVTRCRFNPIDSGQISTSGPQHLRLWKVQEGMLKGYPTIQGLSGAGGVAFTDHAWTNDDRMAVTTDHGSVIIVSDGEPVQRMEGSTHLGLRPHDGLACIAALDRGFVCGGPHGSLVVLEMTDSKERLEGRDPFKLACCVSAMKTEGTPSTVGSLSFSPKFDCLACSFPDNVGLLSMSDVWLKAEQGTSGTRSGSEERTAIADRSNNREGAGKSRDEEKSAPSKDGDSVSFDTASPASSPTNALSVVSCELTYLQIGFHTGAITDMATCARKPLLVTCSKEDKSIRLWNYRLHECLDAIVFTNDAQRPLCVDLHPSGHLVMVGFSGRLHLYHVRLGGLRFSREILVKGSRVSRFSGHGGLIAVACSRRIEVFRTYTEECIGGFTGHAMPITDFAWRKDDLGIVSVAMDGTCYEWDLSGLDGTGNTPCGTRAGEHHSGFPSGSGFGYQAVVCGLNGSVAIAGCGSGGQSGDLTRGKLSDNGAQKTRLGFGSAATRGGPASGSGSAHRAGGGMKTKGQGNSSTGNQLIRAWRTRHLEGRGVATVCSRRVTTLCLNRNHVLLAGDSEGRVVFYDFPMEGNPIGLATPHQVAVSALAVSPDGNVVFTGAIDGTIIISGLRNRETMGLSAAAATAGTSQGSHDSEGSARHFRDEIICLTDIQEAGAIRGRIADLEASILDLKNQHRYDQREVNKMHAKEIADADRRLAETKHHAHEQEVELKRLLRASESESTAKATAKETQHMETAKLLEDLYDRKLVVKQEQLRKVQEKLKDLIVRSEDATVKNARERQELQQSASQREQKLRANFAKEKKQMEAYIQFVKDRYEDTAGKSEDHHDLELATVQQKHLAELLQCENKINAAQADIVLLRKSASMMKESLDEEKQRADMARAEKLGAERRLKATKAQQESMKAELIAAEQETSLKDKQIKQHLRRIGDLERVRRVLQHQLHEARGQLEPMDTELNVMKEQIGELNDEYNSGMRAAAVLQRRAAGGQQRVAVLNKTIQRHERDIAHLKSTIARFSRDVENIVSAPGGSPSTWADGLLKLYREYVTDKKGKIQGPDEATQAEFNRQRQFMERAMEALKKGAKRSEAAVKTVKKKTAVENGVLVAEINQLRRETRQLRNKIGTLETALENVKRGKTYGMSAESSTQQHRDRQLRPEHSLSRPSAGAGTRTSRDNVGAALHQLSSSSSVSRASSYSGADSDREVTSERAETMVPTTQTQSAVAGSFVKRKSRSRMRPSTAGTAGAQNRSYSTTMLRPKSGGRPLTAAQRRRKMPTGPSLSRSMQMLRANQSEQQIERLRAHNSRLVSQNLSLSRRLTRASSAAAPSILASTPKSLSSTADAEGKRGRPVSPPSSAILSRYNSSAGGKPHEGSNSKTSGVEHIFPTSGTRRNQQLSPLVKETLRVA